jgi:hypothetical protein
MAEGSEFDPPVPVSKLSETASSKFAKARRIVLIVRRLQCGRGYCRDVQRKHFAQRATEFASGDQGRHLSPLPMKPAYRQAIEPQMVVASQNPISPQCHLLKLLVPSILTINQVNPLQTFYEGKR